MTLLDLDELLLPYLAEHPPTHILAAALGGYESRISSPVPAAAPGHLAAAAGSGFGIGEDLHAGFCEPVVLDFGNLRTTHRRRR